VSTRTGLIGEYLAAAVILEQGWQVSMAQQDNVDMVAWKDGIFMRVQVKTSTLRSQEKDRSPGYHFQTGSGGGKKQIKRGSYDIFALCAATDRRVWFQAQCCVNQMSLRRSRGFFANPNLESDSFQRAVQIVMETR
jgi:hypothetical protein